MDFSIKNYNSKNFKSSKRKTKNGNDYYHSNVALIAGCGSCALTTGVTTYLMHKYKKTNSIKTMLASLGLSLPLVLLGALADKVTNKERQKTADLAAEVGVENAQLIDENIKVSKNGRAYKETKTGTGAMLLWGLSCFGLSGLSFLLLKKGVVKNNYLKQLSKIFEILIPTLDDYQTFLASIFILGTPALPLAASDLLNNIQEKRRP